MSIAGLELFTAVQIQCPDQPDPRLGPNETEDRAAVVRTYEAGTGGWPRPSGSTGPVMPDLTEEISSTISQL